MNLSCVTEPMLDRLPAEHRALLTPGPDHDELAGDRLTDPQWLEEQVRLRGQIWQIEDRRVLGTLWWYSASTAVVTPTLASLVSTGTALSPGLSDLVLHHTPSSRFGGSHSTAVLGPDPDVVGRALEETFEAVIDALGAVAGVRPRPLWAIAVDAIAGRLLWAGQAVGEVDQATALAEPIVTAIGGRPAYARFVDVPVHAGDDPLLEAPPVGCRRFVRRCSCCLLYRVPDQQMCRACPGHPAADRDRALRFAAQTAAAQTAAAQTAAAQTAAAQAAGD